MAFDYEKYIRPSTFPHIWCPGCGNGIVVKALIRAIDKMGWKKDEVVVVSGIGCSSRTSGYLDFNTLHTTHGRAIAFATGIKIAKPKLHVIVVTGDGDALAIGGNHLIHAARRNMDLTVILFNNSIYAMTGGQYSPATPEGKMASTAPYGQVEPNFDIARLAEGAGASFVARSTVYHAVQLEGYIARALARDGFSLIEAVTQCPTVYGRRNRTPNPVTFLEQFKNDSIPLAKAAGMTDEEREGKIITGIFVDHPRIGFIERYRKMSEKALAIRKRRYIKGSAPKSEVGN
ncbi:MAG: 2-oxoacid:ferredoxin oxidoreductase subunit beta [Deltaproteobacteria bacterium]|nr:2-oxoacid:ferredoxin oxidoreductase subunit beta [Deltaproteobacteria bacterium]